MARVFGVEAGEDALKVFLITKAERLVCPHCGGREVGRKGKRWPELQSVPGPFSSFSPHLMFPIHEGRHRPSPLLLFHRVLSNEASA